MRVEQDRTLIFENRDVAEHGSPASVAEAAPTVDPLSKGPGTPPWPCPSAAGFSFELPSRLFKQHSDNHNDSCSDQRRDDARGVHHTCCRTKNREEIHKEAKKLSAS